MVQTHELLTVIRTLVRKGQAVSEESTNDIFTDAPECQGTVAVFHASVGALDLAIEEGKRLLREAGWPL